MTAKNRQWILARRPQGDIRDGDLVFRSDDLPKPAKGEVVIRNEWLSLDPSNRLWMSEVDQYMPPVPLGAPMRGLVCGTVVESNADALAVGTPVMGLGTWSDYSCAGAVGGGGIAGGFKSRLLPVDKDRAVIVDGVVRAGPENLHSAISGISAS